MIIINYRTSENLRYLNIQLYDFLGLLTKNTSKNTVLFQRDKYQEAKTLGSAQSFCLTVLEKGEN